MSVVEAVRLTDVRRVIHLSTFGVYDWRRTSEVEKMDETFARGSGAAYSNSKAAQEMILEAYRIQCGFGGGGPAARQRFRYGTFLGRVRRRRKNSLTDRSRCQRKESRNRRGTDYGFRICIR